MAIINGVVEFIISTTHLLPFANEENCENGDGSFKFYMEKRRHCNMKGISCEDGDGFFKVHLKKEDIAL
jgi:hypothetical protein